VTASGPSRIRVANGCVFGSVTAFVNSAMVANAADDVCTVDEHTHTAPASVVIEYGGSPPEHCHGQIWVSETPVANTPMTFSGSGCYVSTVTFTSQPGHNYAFGFNSCEPSP
jgi:hypothetical protein